MIAVGGGGCPVGHASRNEPAGIPLAATTVKFTEIASVPAGMPQMPVTSQVRRPLFGKMPPWIGAPLPRVSATRHGWTPMKARGSVTSAIVVNPPDAELPRYGGTVQFDKGMSRGCAIETEETKTTRRTTGLR